jgi:hypothetical protein
MLQKKRTALTWLRITLSSKTTTTTKPNKQNENTKQKEMQTKTKQTEQNKNKIHGDIRKTLLTLNVTYECYSWNAAYSLN